MNGLETRLVFDQDGKTIFWPLDSERSAFDLPDSQDLWEFLWAERDRLGGVAHTHPFRGEAVPSRTDLTTFSAIERGLGRRLLWPIITASDVKVFRWVGPGPEDYAALAERTVCIEGVHELRCKSKLIDNRSGT